MSKFFKKEVKIINDLKLSKKEESAYKDLMKRNKDKGFTDIISRNRFKHLTYSNCFYCGSNPRKYSDSLVKNGIDRVDNTLGYIESNVITCCTTCNFMKGQLEFHTFMNHCEKLGKESSERKINTRLFPEKSNEHNAYLFKYGKYISPNSLIKCIMQGLIEKSEVIYDFEILLAEYPEEYEMFKNQIVEAGVPRKKLKKFTKKLYDEMQLRIWNNSNSPDDFIKAETEEMSKVIEKLLQNVTKLNTGTMKKREPLPNTYNKISDSCPEITLEDIMEIPPFGDN